MMGLLVLGEIRKMNGPAAYQREADHKVREEPADTGKKYAHRVKVNHAVGVLKDRLIGILITEDELVRKWLYQELVSEMKQRIVPIRPNREAVKKNI
jgi:hypothetical protein